MQNPFWKFHPQSLPANGFKYNYIFVPLQDMIERAIISVQTDGAGGPEPGRAGAGHPVPVSHQPPVILGGTELLRASDSGRGPAFGNQVEKNPEASV